MIGQLEAERARDRISGGVRYQLAVPDTIERGQHPNGDRQNPPPAENTHDILLAGLVVPADLRRGGAIIDRDWANLDILRGEIRGFTGIDDPYEAPEKPEILIETEKTGAREAAETILKYLEERGYLSA